MKTKLLRKIRKQYSIVYYPNGAVRWDEVFFVGKYVLDMPQYWETEFDTKEEALECMLDRVRSDFRRYSRSYKNGHWGGKKVWYNG